MGAPRHPGSLDGIDAAWFSDILVTAHPGTHIAAVHRGTVIQGTATKVRFDLDYHGDGNPQALPRAMWVKGGFEAHSADTAAANLNEARFYRDIAPLLPDNVCPRALAYLADTGVMGGLIVLEDLLARGAVFGSAAHALEAAQVARALEAQAAWHARFWDDTSLDRIEWLSAGGSILGDNVIERWLAGWDQARVYPRFAHVPPALDDPGVIGRAMRVMWEHNIREARCFVHGDAGLPNVYFTADGAAGFLDWQQCMRGSWAFDVAPFMVTAMTTETRRVHQRDLLRHYLGCLTSHGVAAPPFEQAWLDYRRRALWMIMWLMCPTAFQPEAVCTVYTARACAAITDLETLAALAA